MKAIKDCEWEVRLCWHFGNTYYWSAWCSGLSGTETICQKHTTTKITARKSWLHFAKLNKIKKWKFV